MQPDQFYKICPGQYKDVTLGQPRCGDGSNFSFIVSRPPEDKQGNGREKIVIELSGGGACWDTISCAMQSMFLSFPQEWLGLLVGKSCSSFNDWMGSMLCSKTVGGIDFSEYTFVMIPYCTQDVHLGDEPSTDYGVRHVGGHNLYRTLTWIFDNFPDPSHIFITGCSAGATPLPVVYDLINSHYRENGKQVQINGIADSPVYLTPSYFLENGLQQWNVETILNMIGFDYDTYKSDEDFPSAVLDHTLDDSKPTDKLGFVLHDGDAVSLLYYAFMTGGAEFGSDLFDRNLRRQLNTDIQSEWWAEISDSMSTLTNEHTNFHSFIIEGTDHCTFGLVSNISINVYVSKSDAMWILTPLLLSRMQRMCHCNLQGLKNGHL